MATMSISSNSFVTYMPSGALTTDPSDLKPYAILANNKSDARTLEGILGDDLVGKVKIGNDFLYVQGQ